MFEALTQVPMSKNSRSGRHAISTSNMINYPGLSNRVPVMFMTLYMGLYRCCFQHGNRVLRHYLIPIPSLYLLHVSPLWKWSFVLRHGGPAVT